MVVVPVLESVPCPDLERFGVFHIWAGVEGSLDTDQAAGSSQKQLPRAFQNSGREDSLILAPRERHRQGTGVKLA